MKYVYLSKTPKRWICVAMLILFAGAPVKAEQALINSRTDLAILMGTHAIAPFICIYQAVAGVVDKDRGTCTRSEKAKPPTPAETAAYEKKVKEFRDRAEAEEKGYIKDAESIPLCLRTGVNECGYPVEMLYCWQKPKEVDSYWDYIDNFCLQTGDISTGMIPAKSKLDLIDRPYRRAYEAKDVANANFVLKHFCYQETADTLKCVEADQTAASGNAVNNNQKK
jgi:hypothetical protein